MTAPHTAQAPPVLPAALVGSSKQKYTLAQARLRRGGLELATLSLHGSLMDGLASYLLTYAPTQPCEYLPDMVQALHHDPRLPLAGDDAERLYLVHDVHQRLVQGEAVTLTLESVFEWLQVAGQVLTRYGVVVSPPESPPRPSAAPPDPRPPTSHVLPLLQRLQPLLLVVLVSMLGLALLVQIPWADLALAPAGPSTPPDASLSPPARNIPGVAGIRPGATAYIRNALDGSNTVGLQLQPGAAGAGQVRLVLAPDTAVQVIAGPLVVDGEGWWQVRVFNLDGWCPGTLLEVR